MAEHAVKKCINPDCGKSYGIDNDVYRCTCGSLLDIKYAAKPSRDLVEVFYQRRNHGGNIYNESGVWRFRDLINFAGIDTEDFSECARVLVSLDGSEGRLSKPYRMSKAADYAGMNHDSMFLQPEGYNPSGSFKDNGMSTAVTHAKMLKVKKIICASTGNTSASAAMYAANEDMECDVYIPKGEIAPGKLGQAFQFGAQVIQVQGNFDDALATSLKNAKEGGGYTVNSVNPFRIEGQKTIVYRVMENLNWNPPDWIVYPGGALGNTSSCGKALIELYEWGWIKKVPRIAVVNAEGANTLYELYNGIFEGKKLGWNGGRPDLAMVDRYYAHLDRQGIRPKTHATAIQIGRPANIAKALRALDFTNGVVVQVSDKEMSDGMSIVGLNGFDCEMASGAVPAGIRRLRQEGTLKRDDVVVGILTGRQKDPALAVEYHMNPANMFARPPTNH
ncbi:pyridoxal-phosphate dependent enzyme [Nitrososphaera sp.]|uniref:threonine synthase n=1 Tax=Nitrososphaera sp. TaxID=1971748 RepID=UPI00307EBF1F